MQLNYRRFSASTLTTGLESRHPGIHLRAAVAADLHDLDYTAALAAIRRAQPDIILIPGDLTEDLTKAPDETPPRPGLGLLSACAALAPTFYSLGNHEAAAGHVNLKYLETHPKEIRPVHDEWRERIRQTGAVLLDEDWTQYRGLVIGGLGSGLLRPGRIPDTSWIPGFCAVPGYKLLLCHQPEYFDRFLRDFPIDLFVAGHAHGGQWRIFGRGVYAPDQGLFPKYTGGVHEGRLLISRGVSNTVSPIPRLFNPREVVVIELI